MEFGLVAYFHQRSKQENRTLYSGINWDSLMQLYHCPVLLGDSDKLR